MQRRSVADAGDVHIWVLASYRAGENSQLRGLAERVAEHLGAEVEYKTPDYTPWADGAALLQRASLAGVTARGRAGLQAPWPDLLFSAGFKNEPLVRYIRRASTGRTRLIMLGRTWAPRSAFDLLITTPQYRVPEEPWVRHNLLTMHGVRHRRLDEARDTAQRLFEHLPRPHITVLLGGSSGPYVLGPSNARNLANQLEALRRKLGGSILVSSSARTPKPFVDSLMQRLTQPVYCYRFQPDDHDNPYRAMLTSASVLVVTSDSVAMLSEAAAAGKRVFVYDVAATDSTPVARAYRWLMRNGPARMTRDVGLFHQAYVANGFGGWLGLMDIDQAYDDPAHFAANGKRAEAEIQATVERVAALLPSAQASTAAAGSSTK